MPDKSELLAALDAALRAVERAIAAELRTRSGEPARPALEALRVELVAERQGAMAPNARGVSRDWIAGAVRSVAAWSPDDEVNLIAALGRVARAAAATAPPTHTAERPSAE
jgi:hypothetical protein